MIFSKKLLLLSALSGGIAIPVVQSITREEVDPSMLEYDSITNSWNQLLKKIPESELKDKISLLFSKNLTTFSTSAIKNTVKQLLVKWVIEIWENPEAYFPLSHKLKKFFSDYQVSYWKIKNDLDELSWDLVKNFFIDFFFKEKGWIFLPQYGDFSSFVLQEWARKEKPMTLYEWTINYSSNTNPSNSIYSSEMTKSKASEDSYLWPEFEYNNKYHDFISQLKRLNKIDLSSFTKKIWTISELKKIDDGRRLGALLHMLSLSNKDIIDSTQQISSIDFKEATSDDLTDSKTENPLYLFLERKKEKEIYDQEEDISTLAKPDECTLVHNSIFTTDFAKKISNYDHDKPDYHFYSSKNLHSCLYGFRELKNGWSAREQLFASREKRGVSFYYLPGKTDNYKIDELYEEISNIVFKYLKENFESIFFKYLQKKHAANSSQAVFNLTVNTSKDIGKWNFSTHFSKYSELLNASSEYLDELYWVDIINEFQKILSQAYKDAPKTIKLKKLNNSSSTSSPTITTEEEYKIQLDASSGLFSPLPFKRAVDLSSSDQEIKFNDLRTSQNSSNNDQRKNDGFYYLFLNTLLSNNKFYSLEEKAANLQEKIKNNLNVSTVNDLFSKNLFIRAQIQTIIEDTALSSDSLLKIWAEKTLFNGSKNNNTDLNQLISNFSARTLKKPSTDSSANGNWKDIIEKTLFLESYQKLPLNEQSIWGTYQNNLSSNDQDSSTKEKNRTLKAKNSWILKNYYLSDSAYESSSEEFKKFLSYLYSVYWMTVDNYSNLPSLINYLFKKNPNKNAYLVWLKEVNEEEMKKLSQQESDSTSASSNSKELPKLFKTHLSSDISNPLLMGQTSVKIQNNNSQENTKEIQFNSENVLYEAKGYSKNNNNQAEKVKLAGFAGLFTTTFSSREIPQDIKTTIFEKFWKFNDAKTNTNYSSLSVSSSSETNNYLEGLFFEDNYQGHFSSNNDLKTFFTSLKTKSKLIKYLNSNDPLRPFPHLLSKVHSLLNDTQLESLDIDQLRKKIISALENNSSDDSNELYKMWNRFSGYLYLGENQKYPYVFSMEEGGKTKNYVAFLYQVNQFDFEKDKIEELKKNLSEDTLHIMISLLASNQEVSSWIYKTGLSSQLSLF